MNRRRTVFSNVAMRPLRVRCLVNGIQLVALLLLVLALVGCQAGSGSDTTAVPPTNTPKPAETTVASTPTPEPIEETMIETAADADVLDVKAAQTGPDTWTFTVTVFHPDNGWEDYANGWDVVLPDGTILKPDPDSPFTRLLLHPHDNEQPFTRSQSGVVIPANVTQVTVRAHDLVDGFGGQEVVVDLTAESGENFEVER